MLQKKLTMNLRFIALRFKIYYDKKRSEKIDLKVGEKTFVLKKNIKIIKKSNKLNHVKLELFKILRNIKEINYELKLSTNIKRKHLIFYISFLKSVHPDILETNIS